MKQYHRLLTTIGGVLIAWPLAMLGCSDDDSPASPDDQTMPTVSINDQTVIEGGTAVFVVSLNEAADRDVTFRFGTSDGTAKAPADYTAVPLTTDTILAGSTGVVVIVATVEDDSLEQTETFYLLLSDLKNAVFSKPIGEGAILDNDAVSYATGVRTILMGSCAITLCHGPGIYQGGLAMDSAQYDVIINATGTYTEGKVVVPGSSSASTLYTTTLPESDSLFPWVSRRMPSPDNFADTLSDNQRQRIRDWIDQGAQDN